MAPNGRPNAASRRPAAKGRRGPAGQSAAAQRTKRRSGTRFTARTLALVVVTLFLLTAYTQMLHGWWQQRSQIHALQAQNRQLSSDIVTLQTDIDRWNDPAYVRTQARERFGWVMPGEVGYRVIGSDGKAQGAGKLGEPAAPKAPTWSGTLWDSVKSAGQQ